MRALLQKVVLTLAFSIASCGSTVAFQKVWRPVDWLEDRWTGRKGLAVTVPAGPGGAPGVRSAISGEKEQLFVRTDGKDWSRLSADPAAPMWVLAGQRAVLIGHTIYAAGDTQGKPLPQDCAPLVGGDGERIVCTSCREAADSPSCVHMRVTEFNQRGELLRDYSAALGSAWASRPAGLARAGGVLLRRPFWTCAPEYHCEYHDCAVGVLTAEGFRPLASSASCNDAWFMSDAAPQMAPAVKRFTD
jgi:hypothetical protein